MGWLWARILSGADTTSQLTPPCTGSIPPELGTEPGGEDTAAHGHTTESRNPVLSSRQQAQAKE